MSPRPANPRVRNGLVAAATARFLSQGFAATGVEEICSLAGVTKGALFHHFEAKEDLALEALSAWTTAGFRAYSAAPFLKAETAVERVLGYVDFTIDLSRHSPIGCLIGTLAQETSASHPALRERCAGAFREWSRGLSSMLDDAQHEAHGARIFDSQSVANHFVAVFEGAQLLAKATQSKTVVREHLGHFRAYVASLLGLPPSRRGPTRGVKKSRVRSTTKHRETR
jgi:TetR/AcrR family transcriptional repressor of nem operon